MEEKNPFEEEKIGIKEAAIQFSELDTNSPASMYAFINQAPVAAIIPIGIIVSAIGLFLLFKGLQIDRIFFIHVVIFLAGCCITLWGVLKAVFTKVLAAREQALFDSIDREMS